VCPEPVLANHLVCRKAHETRCGFLNAGIVSSQASDDGTDVIVRFVNPRTVPVTLDLTVKGKGKGGRHGRGCVLTSASAGVSANLTVLHSDNLWDANTPSEPTAVSPVITAVSDLGKIEVPANSFVSGAVAGVGCALE
jgi:hypothetical protein